MSGTNYSENTEINILNKILNKLASTSDTVVTNFPLIQNVKVTNTTLSVDVENFPSLQDTAPQNTSLSVTEATLSTTATSATELTASSILVNAFILSNISTTDTLYLGFSSTSQPHIISPNGKFIYESDIRQINLNTIYLICAGGINVGYSYFN